ncbi:Yip1 domain family member [Nesidiocoris tenuis]|uniref:Yip1 domain family member n=1 Tax=Nesidiocoris tenuis TaxID=355587 RepID=A0ABN7AJ68_9HEMI|nr:Yip1 domain family member [Nesidiocoris tenuis]
MSGQFNENMWEQDSHSDWGTGSSQSQQSQYQFYNSGNDMVLNADQLSFQQSNYDSPGQADYSTQSAAKMSFFYDQPTHYEQPMDNFAPSDQFNFENEPPLLEELEIYPDLIAKKIQSVLNPFRKGPPVPDHDLGGPLIFCLLFGVTTFFSAGRINFSYVYGIAMSSCIFMYLLLILMCQRERPSLMAVASVMGYGLIPVVGLSALGIFLRLTNSVGVGLAFLAIGWSALAASKEFTSMTGDDQRLLIAYPCAILYGVFTLLVIF